MDLLEAIRSGNRKAIARLLRALGDGDASAQAMRSRLFKASRGAMTLGVTGPPGAGKSTLVDRLIEQIRATGRTVAVIACDPSSPFSGGALLGDRARMQRHALDAGTFLYSMASRGRLGGVADHAYEALCALDAAGFDVVVIETVGTGQLDVDVAAMVGTVLLVTHPAAGDSLQLAKAGILEVADVLVVNKADLPGAEGLAASARAALSARPGGAEAWPVPVIRAVATRGEGVADALAAVERHEAFLRSTEAGATVRRARTRALLTSLAVLGARRDVESSVDRVDEAVMKIENHQSDPFTEAHELPIREARGEGRRITPVRTRRVDAMMDSRKRRDG